MNTKMMSGTLDYSSAITAIFAQGKMFLIDGTPLQTQKLRALSS